MKNLIYFLALLFILNSGFAQENKIDSLLSVLSSDRDDTTKVKLNINLAWLYYNQNNFDSALLMVYNGLELAQSKEYKKPGVVDLTSLMHKKKYSLEELTDLNALCDEYLRLAYHGFRAKEKHFNAEINLDLDPTLTKINVVPQDLGRVLLNLINNALHAVTKVENPVVAVTTKKLENALEIRVADNGTGIPDEIKDKIFQPFFTTKPTGQGTGLGLSLSYDIVKAHGGELKVETKLGAGSLFIIQLPVA